MGKAIGMVEFKTVSTGVMAADTMVKTAEVEIIEAQTVCPGKYIVIITGELSAVRAAVDSAASVSPEMMSPKGIIDGVRRHKMLEVTSVARAMNSIVSCPLARGILPPMYHRMTYIMAVKIVEAYSVALAWTDMRRCACGKYSEVASKMMPKVRLKMKSILLYGME